MLIRKTSLASILLCVTLISDGQSVSTLMGARANGLANASACLSDEWSLFNNPAGLAGLTTGAFAVAYDKTPALPGSDRMAAAAAFHSLHGTLSAGIFRFGDQLYNEQVAATGYAHQLGLAALGVRVNLVQYNAEGFGSRSVISINFGGIAELTPHVKVGAHIINLNQPVVSRKNGERLPTQVIAGIIFTPQENLLVAAEVEKDVAYTATCKVAVEYKAFDTVYFRSGFNLIPELAFIGVGFRSSRFILDYAMEYSDFMGMSHQVSAGYPFRTK